MSMGGEGGRVDALANPPVTWKKMLRWALKKSTRGSLALASWIIGAARNKPNAMQPHGVRVLTYHRFGTTSYDPFCVSPADFDAQMAFLAQHNRALSLHQFEQFLRGDIQVPHGTVLVTIDDGHLSTWSTAMPILRKHGIPAVAFVTTNLVGRGLALDAHIPEGYASWSQLRELLNCGIEVASHSMSHSSLGSMSASKVVEEAAKSKAILEDRLGKVVSAFAYPY